MADTKLQINLSAIKRVDSNAKNIVESSLNATLNEFDKHEKKWKKSEIEGPLFVYSRNCEPYYSLVILNRLSLTNAIEPVSIGLELQVHKPRDLLYRNSEGCIYGLWFYYDGECARVAKKLYSLVRKLMIQSTSGYNLAHNREYIPATAHAGSMYAFSMLNKSQDDPYNGIVPNKNTKHSAAAAPDITSQSVIDFFAQAKCTPHGYGRAQDVLLLQKLQSNPEYSSEYIEKQQRSAGFECVGLNGNFL